MGLGYEGLPEPVARFAAEQYRLAYDLIASVRDPRTGAYADSRCWTDPDQQRRCSIASVGVGLVALCIAHAEGWEPAAADLARQTLEGFSGGLAGFQPAREPGSGFFRHFIDGGSGAVWGKCEYSTIDTALLVAGGLFAARYFRDDAAIAGLAEALFSSIDWGRALADPQSGSLFMVVDDQGSGGKPNHPWSEYAVLAWLIRRSGDEAGLRTWNGVFVPDRLAALPHGVFDGIRLLSGRRGSEHFLSSFVHQFPYYLVHDYTVSPAYRAELAATAAADRRFWLRQPHTPTYLWGTGAGPCRKGYHADAIERCPDGIVSPHIVAGYLPIDPAGIYDLYDMACTEVPYTSYTNPADPEDERRFRAAYRYGLHRFVPRGRQGSEIWYPPTAPLVDWSTLLYGLCAFHRGDAFFATYNAFGDGAA